MTLSIFRAAEQHPESLAFIGAREQLSYRALSERSARVAATLRERGLVSAERSAMGVVARPTLATIELLHALIALHVPVLLLQPSLPERERQALLARAGARALLCPDEAPIPHAERPLPPPIEAADLPSPLAIVPTSGSSGAPKLVVLSRGAFIDSARASAENLPLGAGDRWLLCLPPAHVGGFSILTRSLLAGSAVVAFDTQGHGLIESLPALAKCIAEQQVSVLSLVPTVLDALLTSLPEWRPPLSLRAVLVGGAALSESLLDRARSRNVPLLTTYGLTEACSQVATTRPGEWPRVSGGVVSSGHALPGVELAIGDGSRIRVRTGALCSGYLGASAPFDEHGWFNTEDRGFIDGEGQLFVLGRVTDLIISGGENVDPLRVEGVLAQSPGVSAALVFGVPDERFGELVACALVTQPGFDQKSLSAFLRERLARHELPRRMVSVAALPLLPNGKLDRASARARLSGALEALEHPRQ